MPQMLPLNWILLYSVIILLFSSTIFALSYLKLSSFNPSDSATLKLNAPTHLNKWTW